MAKIRRETVLPGGIRLLTRQMPHTRAASVGVWLAAGSRDETRRENGLSHFIEHMLFKGTTRHSAMELARAFDAVGAHLNAFTSTESLCCHVTAMDEAMDTVLDLLADMILTPVFDPAEVEREKSVILQEIEMGMDSPDEFLHQTAETAFWGEDHPLGRPITGTRESLAAVTRNDLFTYYRKIFRPDRMFITAAGNISHDRLETVFAPRFSALPAPDHPFFRRPAPMPGSGCRTAFRDLGQLHMSLMSPAPAAASPDRYAASLLHILFGGNMSSCLFQEIREKRGLAYSVYSFSSPGEDAGANGLYAACDPGRAGECLDAVAQVVDQMQAVAPASARLDDAKTYLKSGLIMAAESVEHQMSRLAQDRMVYGRHIPLDDVIQAMEAVTAEEVREIARILPRPEDACLVLLGPEAAVRPLEERRSARPARG
ncbi:MAG: peptidase M16 [Desulfobacterales bacterium]|nr:MAG: peptidase M16 [Desulfobacterales bacterium]